MNKANTYGSVNLDKTTHRMFRACSLAGMLAMLAAVGCATLRPAVAVRTFGDVDPARDRQLAETAKDRSIDSSDVRVLTGALPDGLELTEQGSKLVVKSGFEASYDVLGMVEADYMRVADGAFIRNSYWTWDYDDGWRKGLCYPQVPLKILTLGIWNLVPLAYPCVATAPSDEHEREEALIAEIRRGAKTMGGNLVLVSRSSDATIIHGNKYGVSTTVVNMVALKGFVVKASERRSPTAPSPKPATDRTVYFAPTAPGHASSAQ